MRASLRRHLRAQLADIDAAGLTRRRRVITGAHGVDAIVDGQPCVNFCSNDYLGLAAHPDLARALADAAARLGSGAGASQLITGYNGEHAALEAELADYLGCGRALLFSSGYAANMGVIAALVGKPDTIVADALNHASLIDGARLSGAAKRIYAHADADAAAAGLAACPDGHRLLVSDSVFSMDGDLAPLAALSGAASAHDAWLMIDDAHGFGMLGGGRGAVHEAGADNKNISPDIYIATLGKAVGAAGAFVAGDEALIEMLIQRARPLIFSTAPPPPVAAAARAGLRLLRREAWRREHLLALVQRFRQGCAQLGISLGVRAQGSQTPIVSTPIQPLILGDEAAAIAASDALLACGYLAAAIRPPTVPAGTARLRITLSAAHSEDQVDGLLDALATSVGTPAAAAR